MRSISKVSIGDVGVETGISVALLDEVDVVVVVVPLLMPVDESK